jgi:hypothetical protein
MANTYIELCNQTLRRIGEVEIAQADFASVRGVQALVKDAVKATIAKINQAEFEWPFNAAQETVTVTTGQTEYSFPTAFKVVDWNSFQIQSDVSLNVGYTTLSYIDRDEWYARYRDNDYNAGSVGRGVPSFVCPSHGNGYGITPSPNAAYTITYRYYLNYSDLTAYDDVTRIPESFNSVLVDGALYHMNLYKNNAEGAQAAFMSFEAGLKDLQTLYINNYEYVRDTRVRY